MFDLDFFIFYGLGAVLSAGLMIWWLADRKKIGEPVVSTLASSLGDLFMVCLLIVWPIAILVIFSEVILRSAAREGGRMKRGRRACFSFTLFLAIFFAVVIVATWAASDFFQRKSVTYLAREIQPSVNQAIEFLERPAHKASTFKPRMIIPDDSAEVRRELEKYRDDPVRYIQAILLDPPERKVTKDLDSINTWQVMVFNLFKMAYWQLILDVRVFAFTNMTGFLILAFMIADRSALREKVIPPTAILATAIVLSIYSFFDSFSCFTILSGWNMAAWYPGILLILFGIGILHAHNSRAHRAVAAGRV